MRFSHHPGICVSFALIVGLGLVSLNANAQTWASNRQGPGLPEIVTIDQTGEAGWLWGDEDVAGDGASTFDAPEQAIDGRAVYLTTADSRLWFRLTLSATAAPEGNLVTYLFIDADQNTKTGRSAAATEIDPVFTKDPTGGGYEYVLAVRGDGTADGLWELNNNDSAFVAVTLNTDDLRAERGLYLDPLRIGQDDHGYVQASVLQTRIGLTTQCSARFFVRSTNDNAALGKGDIDIGEAANCIPTDVNHDDVPDLLEPAVECNVSDDCAANAVCWNHRCWLAAVCVENKNCTTTETCVDGQCRATGGDGCNGSTGCGALVCKNGQCVACTTDSSCNTGQVCGPDGRCVDKAVADNLATNGGASSVGGASGVGGSANNGGNANAGAGNDNGNAGSGVVLDEGERVQGGACACRAAGTSRSGYASLLIFMGLGLLVRRNGRRELA